MSWSQIYEVQDRINTFIDLLAGDGFYPNNTILQNLTKLSELARQFKSDVFEQKQDSRNSHDSYVSFAGAARSCILEFGLWKQHLLSNRENKQVTLPQLFRGAKSDQIYKLKSILNDIIRLSKDATTISRSNCLSYRAIFPECNFQYHAELKIMNHLTRLERRFPG